MNIFDCFDTTYGSGFYESIPDSIGGMDILHDGLVVDHIEPGDSLTFNRIKQYIPNFEGGTDVIIDGKVAAHSQANVFGGVDTYKGTELVASSVPNVMGGVDIYGEDMSFMGSTIPNVFGDEDYVVVDNTEKMLSLEDPLLHAAKFRLESLKL